MYQTTLKQFDGYPAFVMIDHIDGQEGSGHRMREHHIEDDDSNDIPQVELFNGVDEEYLK